MRCAFAVALLASLIFVSDLRAESLMLDAMISEAIANNPELKMVESRWTASTFKAPQAISLPDPMVMFGYQNEGWDKYTYGEMSGAQYMLSVSQMMPYPGKRELKKKMAEAESTGLRSMYENATFRIITDVKEKYFDLFLIYKNLELIDLRKGLLIQVEDSALSKYSSGMGMQQDVMMAQSEKYMLMEKSEMLRQKKDSTEAMLNQSLGREGGAFEKPSQPESTMFDYTVDELVSMAISNSPSIASKQVMADSGGLNVDMMKKEFYPDFTFTGTLGKRPDPFEDMWSLTVSANIPLRRESLRNTVLEAEAKRNEAHREVEAEKQMLSAKVRDNYAMLKSSERLMELYKNVLIPKARQTYESAYSGYIKGKVDVMALMKTLTLLLDYETMYWTQFVEREKSIARIFGLAGIRR